MVQKQSNSSIFSCRLMSKSDHDIVKYFKGIYSLNQHPIPITSNYKSKIGTDRLSAIVGASFSFSK